MGAGWGGGGGQGFDGYSQFRRYLFTIMCDTVVAIAIAAQYRGIDWSILHSHYLSGNVQHHIYSFLRSLALFN
jgi:hypothetical protein